MTRTIAVLGIVATLLAAVSSIVLFAGALLLPTAFAFGAGLLLALSRDWRRLVPGISAMVFAVAGLFLGLGDDGFSELFAGPSIGHALVVIGCLEISGASLLLAWDDMDPKWVGVLWGALWAGAFLAAILLRDDLTNQSESGGFIVAGLALANMVGPIIHLRQG